MTRLTNEQTERLSALSKEWGAGEESLLDEALNELECKYTNKKKRLAGKTAMIVDDSAVMRMMLEESLSKVGVAVAARAENGFEAVKLYNDGPLFDFVFLNVTMPQMDGIEALEDFRDDRGARIIMVTSTRLPSLVLESVKNGAHRILYRPFEHKDLVDSMACSKVFVRDMYPELKERIDELGLPEDFRFAQGDVNRLVASLTAAKDQQ